MTYAERAQLDQLAKHKKIAHYLLLATAIATVINIALLLGKSNFAIPYCSAISFYLTFLGFFFDGYTPSTYTSTGMVMSFAVLAVWLLVWFMSRHSRKWLLAGMVLVIADTLALAGFAFAFLENPSSCLLEGLLHLAVIYEIWQGVAAYPQEAALHQQIAHQAEAEVESPAETITDSDEL